jgi:hypothetical protein
LNHSIPYFRNAALTAVTPGSKEARRVRTAPGRANHPSLQAAEAAIRSSRSAAQATRLLVCPPQGTCGPFLRP